MHHQPGVVREPRAQAEGNSQVRVRGAVDKAVEHARGVTGRGRVRHRQFARQHRSPPGGQRQGDAEWLAAGDQVTDRARGRQGSVEDQVRPVAASPAGSIQNRPQCGERWIGILTVDVLPPPRHRRTGRAAERPAPNSLPKTAQVRVRRPVPALPTGAVFVNEHRLPIFLPQVLRRGAERRCRPGRTVRVRAYVIHLRQTPHLGMRLGVSEARGEQMAERIVRPHPVAHHSVPRRHVAGAEQRIDVVNLVEELPGQQIRAVAISRHQVAQPLG